MEELQQMELHKIETEIKILKNQTAQNIIEIGNRLIAAKEFVTHGEWGRWLEEKVKFSDQTARKFMKIASEYGNSKATLNMGTEKLWLLLDVPKEEREEFIRENKVDEMTTRELQQVIKEKKELEHQLEQLKNRPPEVIEKEVEKVVEVIPPDYESLKGFQQRHADLCYENSKLEGEIQRLKRQSENKELSSKEYDKLRKELSEKSEKIHDLKKQIDSLLVTDAKEVHLKKLQDTAITFSNRVHSFINSVGGLGWLIDYLDELPKTEKEEYVKAIYLLERWVTTIKSNL